MIVSLYGRLKVTELSSRGRENDVKNEIIISKIKVVSKCYSSLDRSDSQ